MDLTEEDLELLDPHPDIHSLFVHYNQLYFDNQLGACSVEWSSARMTLCGGVCEYQSGGGCRIKLSEPLLKLRPARDLKEVLLHEMIHASMMLRGIRDDEPSGHGTVFKGIMRRINESTLPDSQRPRGGYHIDTHHTMLAEVDFYRQHHWQCERCGNLVKRAMNRPPQEADCRGRVGKGPSCRDPDCKFHMHQRHCGGTYVKIKEPEGYGNKSKAKKPAAGPSHHHPDAGLPPKRPKKGSSASQDITKFFGKGQQLGSVAGGTAGGGSNDQGAAANEPAGEHRVRELSSVAADVGAGWPQSGSLPVHPALAAVTGAAAAVAAGERGAALPQGLQPQELSSVAQQQQQVQQQERQQGLALGGAEAAVAERRRLLAVAALRRLDARGATQPHARGESQGLPPPPQQQQQQGQPPSGGALDWRRGSRQADPSRPSSTQALEDGGQGEPGGQQRQQGGAAQPGQPPPLEQLQQRRRGARQPADAMPAVGRPAGGDFGGSRAGPAGAGSRFTAEQEGGEEVVDLTCSPPDAGVQSAPGAEAARLQCPICGREWRADELSNEALNAHIDACLAAGRAD